MKKIKLKEFQKPELDSIYTDRKKYKFFYNSKTVYFTSQRDCTAFMNNISQNINVHLSELNIIYVHAFTYYRNNFKIIEKQMFNSNFHIIESRFNNSYNRSSINSSSIVFSNAYMIITQLLEVFEYFADLERNRGTWEKLEFANIFINRLIRMKQEIDNL